MKFATLMTSHATFRQPYFDSKKKNKQIQYNGLLKVFIER